MKKIKWAQAALKFIKSPSVIWILVIVALVIVLLKVSKIFANAIKRILALLGLADTPEEQDIKVEQAKAGIPGNPWSIETWKSAGAINLTVAQADEKAKTIHWALSPWRVWGNDEQAVIGAIKSCPTKADVSFVCWRFNELYKQDMFSYMYINEWWNSEGLNDAEMKIITDYVNRIPNK